MQSKASFSHESGREADSHLNFQMPSTVLQISATRSSLRSSLSERFNRLLAAFRQNVAVISSYYQPQWTHFFTSRVVTPVLQENAQVNVDPAVTPLSIDSALEKIREGRTIVQTTAAVAARELDDLKVRTHSLLNAASKEITPPFRSATSTFARLRALMEWRQTSTLTDYSNLFGLNAEPEKLQALKEWDASYESLRLGCQEHRKSDLAEKTHAQATLASIMALSQQGANSKSVVRYAGSFGKKQTFIQALLSKAHANKELNIELPAFMADAIEQGVMDSPEEILSYGIDLALKHLLDHQPEESLEKFNAALEFLQPFLPNPERNSPTWDTLKHKLPTWMSRRINDTVQQGALSLFLDLIPDSTLRDHCVDLVEKLAAGQQAENREVFLLEWKKQLVQTALSNLPVNSAKNLNSELEEGISSMLRGIHDVVDQQVSSTLFTYGTYWFEWSYHPENQYSLTIYASGSALTNASYPMGPSGLIWPLCITQIKDPQTLLPILTNLSETTALTNGWKKQSDKSLQPLTASEIFFGEYGLLPLLKSSGAKLLQSGQALPPSSATFNQIDMVSHYHAIDSNPNALRYQVFREALLEAIAPFAKIVKEGEPPRLDIPSTPEGAEVLKVFQSSLDTLKSFAQKGDIDAEALEELNAFQEQLFTLNRARSAAKPALNQPSVPELPPSELGSLLDRFLENLCYAEGQVHFLTEYKDVLVFMFEGSTEFVDKLCERADQIQQRKQALNAQQAAATPVQQEIDITPSQVKPKAVEPVTHRERGWVGQLLYSSAMCTLWKVFCIIYQIEMLLCQTHTLLNRDYVRIIPQIARSITPKQAMTYIFPLLPASTQKNLTTLYTKLHGFVTRKLRDLLFAIIFPHVKDNKTIQHLRNQVSPYLKSLIGQQHMRLPVVLPEPLSLSVPLGVKSTFSHTVGTAKREKNEPFFLSSSRWYREQARCAKADSLEDLSNVLGTWYFACIDFPHLLIHQIHQLPISRDPAVFINAFHVNPANQKQNESDIKKAIKEVSNLGKTLFDQYQIFYISWRDYQLAQYRLFAFMDILARQLPDHPLGDLHLDASPLLTEWMKHDKEQTDNTINPTPHQHAKTLIEYFYPDVTFESLSHCPPSEAVQKEWQAKRWFCNIHEKAALNTRPLVDEAVSIEKFSPEFVYYHTLSEKNPRLYYLETNASDEQTTLPIKPSNVFNGRVADLFYIAHRDQNFEHPLHLSVPALRQQMLRCQGMILDDQYRCPECAFKGRITYPTSQASKRDTSFHKLDARSLFVGSALDLVSGCCSVVSYSADIISRMTHSFDTISRSSVYFHFERANTSQIIDSGKDSKTEIGDFWMQEGEAAAKEPLTAPLRALRLIAKDPIFAASSSRVESLSKMILCLGRLELDLQHNPALIEDYSKAMASLLHAASDFLTKISIIQLTLSIRNRARVADPQTRCFNFLKEELNILRAQADSSSANLSLLAMKTLYEDCDKPNELSQKKQKQVFSLLLNALAHFQTYRETHRSTHNRAFYIAALQQMATRWFPCMFESRRDPVPSISLTRTLETPVKTQMQDKWATLAQAHAIKECILAGETPLESTWMEISPLEEVAPENQEHGHTYRQTAKICRRLNNITYSLMTDSDTTHILLQNISSTFHYIDALKAQDAKCWIHLNGREDDENPAATLLVTQGNAQYRFALHYKAPSYELLGMIEEDESVVYPAAAAQVEEWCAPWSHFCPLSSIRLLVDRKTGRPAKCHMIPFNLKFNFTEKVDENGSTWRAENPNNYPGYWISKTQNMPLGLILENQEGGKQLLLPNTTLPQQALYTQVDSFFGIFGNWIQRQRFFHTENATPYSYTLVSGEWESKDPYAMTHLLLLYFAGHKKASLRAAGEFMTRMKLPEDIEMQLLPLHLAQDRKTRRLHARLLIQIETSLLAKSEQDGPENKPAAPQQFIDRCIPAQYTPLFALISVYRALACETNLDLPDTKLHTLFARYRTLLAKHKDQLIDLFECKDALRLLSVDYIALRSLPESVRKRIQPQERSIGNAPSLADRAVRFAVDYRASSSPLTSLQNKAAYALSQAASLKDASQVMLAVAGRLPQTSMIPWSAIEGNWKIRLVRQLRLLKPRVQEKLSKENILEIMPKIEQAVMTDLTPHSLDQETVITQFFTYQAMAQGKFGGAKQAQLLQQLYFLQWLKGKESKAVLSRVLFSLAKHPERYLIYNWLLNRGRSIQELVAQQAKNEQQIKANDAVLLQKTATAEIQSVTDEQTKQTAQRKRVNDEAIVEQWNTLMRFEEVQPQWDAIEEIGKVAIGAVGTSYLVPIVSKKLAKKAVDLSAHWVPKITQSRRLKKAMPVAAVLGAATYLMRSRLKKQTSALQAAAKKGSTALLQPVNQFTGLKLTPEGVAKIMQASLTEFGTRYLTEYLSQTVIQPIFDCVEVLTPIGFDMPAKTQKVMKGLTNLNRLYSLYRLCRVMKAIYQDSGLTKKVVVIDTANLPSIPQNCKQSMHKEDRRWKNVLETLFEEHFVSKQLEREPVRLEEVQSSKIQTALTAYAEQTASNPRMLYCLRSKETLKKLSTQIALQLKVLQYIQKRDMNKLLDMLAIPAEERKEALEAFRHFFCVGETAYLNEKNITEKEQHLLQSVLPVYFLRETETQQLERIAKALNTVQKLDAEKAKDKWEAACEQLITQMRARRVYDLETMLPDRLRLFLAFESSTGILLWKQQVEALGKVLDTQDNSVAYELLMSLGKTFFAIPMTALAQADGKKAVFFIWPEPMCATQTDLISKQMQLLGGRQVTPLSINRALPLTIERLDGLLRLIEDTKSSKGAISTRKRDMQALDLLFVDLLNKLVDLPKLSAFQATQVMKLQRLLVTLYESCVYIGDEAHELFQDIVLNFPVGTKEKLPTIEADGVRTVMTQLLQGELGDILRTHTSLNDKKGSQALFQTERRKVAEKFAASNLCASIDKQHHQEIVNYLLDATINTPACLLDVPKARKAVNAARGAILHLCPLLFTRSIGGSFGLSKQHPDLAYVIPYDGNDNAAESKRIATPHEALVKTFVYHWHHGIDTGRLNRLVKACNARSKQWVEKNKRPYSESPAAQAFAKLFGEGSIQTLEKALECMDRPERIEHLFAPLNNSLDLIALYSQYVVEPELECQAAQCSSSADDFHNQFLSGKVCTGTPFNAETYPLEMERQLDAGTLGEAITHIKNKCPKEAGVQSLTSARSQDLLDEILDKYFLSDIEATSIEDGGGLLTGVPHDMVARRMLEKVRTKRPDVQVVDYFTIDKKTGKTVCMSWIHGASHPVPMETCQIPLEKRLAYFDQSHCFAANIPQHAKAKGVWLVGTSHPLYKGMQDAFRMRGLKKYTEFLGLLQSEQAMDQAAESIKERDLQASQTLYVALAPQVGELLKPVDGTPTKLEAVLDFMAKQEKAMMQQVHLQRGLSILKGKLRQATKMAMLGNGENLSSVSNVLKAFKNARSLFVTPTAQNATALYGGARIEVTGKEVLTRHYNQTVSQINNNSLLTTTQRQEALAKLKETFDHFDNLSLPSAVSVTVDESGNYALDVDGAGQEVEVEVEVEVEMAQEAEAEKEQEKETEKELEKQRQIEELAKMKPLYFKPEKWDANCPLDSRQWQWVDPAVKEDNVQQLQNGLKGISRALKSAHGETVQSAAVQYTPPIAPLKGILQNAAATQLQALSSTIDRRIWWSNHLLPQVHLTLGIQPGEPATGRQHPISHLLVEVKLEMQGRPTEIVSVGCLGPSDASYWQERLQKEQHEQDGLPPESLFMLYQMPVLESLQPGQQFDGTVIARNQKHDWDLIGNPDFQRLETMIKFCNGDKRYTEAQTKCLEEWKKQYTGKQAKTLQKAFDLFDTMAKARLRNPVSSQYIPVAMQDG